MDETGGGSLPNVKLPGWAVALKPSGMSVNELECRLRLGRVPVIIRIQDDKALISPRTLMPGIIISDKEFVMRELAKKNFSDTELIDAIEMVLLEIRSQKTKINEQCRKRNEWNRDVNVSAEDKRKLRERISNSEKDLKNLEKHVQALLYDVPNFPDAAAPVGTDESGNIVISESADHHICEVADPAPHWDVAEKLGILDASCASRISGPGFGMFIGKGAKLLRALVNYGMSLHEGKYLEMLPPHLVSSQSLAYTGHLPKFAKEQYKCENDDLWLIPTAEVPMTAAFAGTVFPAGALPKHYMGYTLAFRREAGTSGRDTRGLQRVHEFHKVELLKIAEPESVQTELDDLLEDCLKIIKDLRLQYRVVDLCTGEMGDKYARCYDIEVYSPGLKKWLEVSSVGHFSDYQARRANIKYIDAKGKKRTAYTLNGSGIATARVWLAIIETYQHPNGSVSIPEVLKPFMGCDVIGY
jgi:seryl-tRNA synthetase